MPVPQSSFSTTEVSVSDRYPVGFREPDRWARIRVWDVDCGLEYFGEEISFEFPAEESARAFAAELRALLKKYAQPEE